MNRMSLSLGLWVFSPSTPRRVDREEIDTGATHSSNEMDERVLGERRGSKASGRGSALGGAGDGDAAFGQFLLALEDSTPLLVLLHRHSALDADPDSLSGLR